MAQAFGSDCCADMLIFSIKEAFFKAIFPLCRQYLEFTDAIVALSPADYTFSVQVVRADVMAHLGRTKILGRYRYDARRVYSAVSLLNSSHT